jgi:stress response protein YsnF
MAFNVMGLFDNPRDAQAAAQELRDTGFSGNDIRDSHAAGGAGMGTAAGGLVDALIGTGVPEGDANIYAEGVHRGGSLLSVQVDDEQRANQAAEVMDRHHVVDINQRGQEYHQTGWTHFDPNAEPHDDSRHDGRDVATARIATETVRTTGQETTGMRTGNIQQGGDIKVPVIEERLNIGTREVDQGGVRVYKRVEEVPVEKQVTLRDETVQVERVRVDQPIDPATLSGDGLDEAFRPMSVELRERDEVPVVEKQARIAEEVVINKDVQERTETVRDTVRRTDVHVEEIAENARAVGSGGAVDQDRRRV